LLFLVYTKTLQLKHHKISTQSPTKDVSKWCGSSTSYVWVKQFRLFDAWRWGW